MRRGVRCKTIHLLLPNNLSFWDSWFMMRVTRKEMRNTHPKEEEKKSSNGNFLLLYFLPVFLASHFLLKLLNFAVSGC